MYIYMQVHMYIHTVHISMSMYTYKYIYTYTQVYPEHINFMYVCKHTQPGDSGIQCDMLWNVSQRTLA